MLRMRVLGFRGPEVISNPSKGSIEFAVCFQQVEMQHHQPPQQRGDTNQKPEPRPTAHSQTLLARNTFQFTYLEQRASVDTGTCGTKTREAIRSK